MGNWVSWILIVGGLVCVTIESALGAATGLDLALVGTSLTIGGVIGLTARSPISGLLAAGGCRWFTLAVFRRWLKAKLTVKNQLTNADAVIEKTGVVTKRIASRTAGMLKLGDEIWLGHACERRTHGEAI